MPPSNSASAHAATASGTRPALVVGTLVAACVAVLVAQVANALPASLNGLFQSDLHTTGSQLTWITAAFMIAVVVFELTFGVLGDLFGRRRLQAAGGVVLVLGSLVSALAPTVEVLWVGAALSGLGAGALFPASLALVAAVTPTPEGRARGIALWAGFLSAGAAVSPLLGGVFAEVGSWRGSFGIVAGLAVMTVLVTLLCSVESTAPEGRGLDVPGQITFAVGLIAVLYALVQGTEDGWGRPHIVIALILGALSLALFVRVELRAATPLLQLDLFGNRAFSVASIVTVVGMFAFLGSAFSFSIWLGAVQHQAPARVGIPLLLIQAPAFVLIPVVSRLLARVNARWLLTVGFALMAGGAWLASRLDVTDASLAPMAAPALLIGIGFALSVSSFTAVAINTVPPHLAGMASATTNLLRDLGFALGPILAGAVALSAAGNQLGSALATANLPVEQARAATGVFQAGGALAVNGLPPEAPGATAHPLALAALGGGFHAAFLICAIAALAAAALTLVGLSSGTRESGPSAESPADTVAAPPVERPLAVDGSE
jgi:MFS family permease